MNGLVPFHTQESVNTSFKSSITPTFELLLLLQFPIKSPQNSIQIIKPHTQFKHNFYQQENMEKLAKNVLFSCFLIIYLTVPSSAQVCSNYAFSNNNMYTTCINLPVLDSFLHWTYHPTNQTVDLAYRHIGMTSTNWIAYALNPGSGRMLGAQSIIAFQNSSGQIHAYTSPISSTRYETTLPEGPLSFDVPQIGAELNGNEMIIYATILLPGGRTTFTHVWQFGDVSGNIPQSHVMTTPHRSSFQAIDFATGTITNTGSRSGSSLDRNRNIHGVLNVVSWGIMLPLGALIARYLKVFKAANPAWFYIHITCQTSAYIVGVAGWGTGLRLGSDSVAIEQTVHRNIGITLFVLGTLQVFALLLRPKPDHKYRFYWNMYHHLVGYVVIILSIVNVFEGFEILDPEERWRRAYYGVLIFLGACFVILEPSTWYIVLKRKRDSKKNTHVPSSANGVNGYDA